MVGSMQIRLCASFFAVLLATAPSGTPVETAAEGPPNILFIFSDDHATHAIGAYEGALAAVDPTPNIDRLASEGVRFENSFCTNSICGPSRAVILTGKHSHRNGFMHNGHRFDGDQETFPKLLQKGGYRTALIGKWHLGSDPQGFDYWDVLPGQGDYYNPKLINAQGERQVEGYCTDIVTDLAIEWLEANAEEDEPFMLMCQHKAPHRNWMPALRHLSLYGDQEIPEPATLFDTFDDSASPARIQEMEIDRHLHLYYDLFFDPAKDWELGIASDRSGQRNREGMTEAQRKEWDAAFEAEDRAMLAAKLEGRALVSWKYQRYIKNYLRSVRGVDESVGRLMSYLESTGLDENTVVIYSSDQGFYLGDHGWYDKRWMYEESLRMPLIVKWPGVTRGGSVNRDLVQNLDYAETFLEMAGLEAPPEMQGSSLVPLLRGVRPEGWRDSIYYHYYAFPSVHMVSRHHGVRTRDFKLMRFYQFDEWEFYDLRLDPDELSNEYGNSEYAKEVARHKAELERLRVHYEDDSDLSVMSAEWRETHGEVKGKR